MVARKGLRPSKLDYAGPAARRSVQASVARSAGGGAGRTVVGVLVGVESPPLHPSWRVQVQVLGGVVWLPADPGAYVIGGSVYVDMDGSGRPVKVTGPTGVPVPDSTVPSTVETGGTLTVIQPAAILDQEARDAANDAVTKLGRAFTTSTDEPTVADGADRPNNAVWTVVNDDGEQVSRFRWDATGQEWVSEPLSVEIIPEAYIAHLLADEVFTSSLVLADEVDGWVTQNSALGLRVFSPEGPAVIQLGVFDETGLILYRDGAAQAWVTDEGEVGGQVISASESLLIDGEDVRDLLDDSSKPRGIVGERVFADTRGPWTIETGVGYVGALVEPGRAYKITASGHVRDTGGVGVDIQMRVGRTGSEDQGWPTPNITTNPTLTGNQRVGDPATEGGYRVASASSASVWQSFEKSWYYTHPDPEHLSLKPTRWLLTLAPLGSTGSVEWLAGGIVRVEDIGAIPTTNSGWHMGGSDGGSGGSPTPPPPDPTPPRTRRRLTRSVSWSKSWQENGQAPGAIQNYLYQGRTPYYTTAGRYRSMAGFASMTSALSGADIERIRVRVKVAHGGGSGGRMTVVVGTHGATSTPNNFSVINPGQATATISSGDTRWLTLPTSMHAGFKDGTLRGIVFYTTEQGASHYGYISPSSVQIQVDYLA